ncbi:PREDICTED: peroxisomal membrane protein PEX13-like [Priapulus caudatus]|uniref:Peroxisomal membrane protein PEX13 n=1 Tax=Priapulus caudatus TaxID=37621 RepID=A0ABM1EQU9_PRICU|nr:PREDICTED: peroxisomal membrane protein PEX13-like [Priapulus caudatus]
MKPWEKASYANLQSAGHLPKYSSINPPVINPHGPAVRNYSATTLGDTGGGGGYRPPPVPLRPLQQQANNYGYSPGYGGFSPLGNHGGYGNMYNGGMIGGVGGIYNGTYGGYGRPAFGNQEESSFVRIAEDSSRNAFQSIESIVHTVGSVSMMLESTYNALYSSFRAVLGVADHFSRLKNHMTQILSALALVKTLKWVVRQVLVLLRLRQSGLPEDAWAEAAETAGVAYHGDGNAKGKSTWPILLFFSVVLGGPWIIWRLLKSMMESESADSNEWADGGDHFVALAEYDFTTAQEGELTFRAGQHITVAPKEMQPKVRGWLLASMDGKKIGLIPANYVKVLGKRKGRKNQQSAGVAGERQLTAPTATVADQQVGTSPQTSSTVDMDDIFENPSPESEQSGNGSAPLPAPTVLNTTLEGIADASTVSLAADILDSKEKELTS